ncbi:helix-turn-helix domain-containing protein [Nocardia sp. SYP-A9097]|uniref:helix-turn-helix domain-containing protein n=1 Tax=Nocardia sp. SYP-A9097 TaxID=2663237 RepID=UPI00129B674E|nr:helix-turn-helix domain-containing protein [Nocardia sp. SYP-A9097]MRH88690.1 helix-turn-helix domain-containing protein [Nocardia sp. SYP-A9097]
MADDVESPPVVRQIAVRSGPELSRPQAFERWEAQMIETYFPLAVPPLSEGEFHGRITHGRYGEIDVTQVGSSPQQVSLTDSLIAAADDEYLLASIGIKGRGLLHLDGATAALGPGDMVFFGSSRRLRWDFDSTWDKTVLQVPVGLLREHGGITLEDVPLCRTITADSVAGVVARFFLDLARLQRENAEHAALLAESALDLLVAAARSAGGLPRPPAGEGGYSAEAFDRRQVLEYMRARCTDPAFTVDRIAQGCMLSRRTLYRIFDGMAEGPAAVLWRMRVEHARGLLARSELPVAVVAAGSGFRAESHFFRVFRELTGLTPGEYRASCGTGA